MADDSVTTTGIARHGATRLPSVEVDSFNIELKDDDGFLGDRASKGAFRKILDTLAQAAEEIRRRPVRARNPPTRSPRATSTQSLVGDDIEAAAVVHSAIEEFAQELAYVTGGSSRPRPGPRPSASWSAAAFAAEPGRRARDRAHRDHPQG